MSEFFRKPIVKTLMLKGQEGQSIKGIEKTGTDVLVDTYTITLTDGTTSTFTVTNGKGISSLEKTGTSGLVDTYTITLTDGTTSTFTVTNGKGISSLEKTGTSGLVDTYTIKFNDGTNSTFTVTNGDSAYKPAVEALGKRIDNLILSSGTESSAEVVDARNGYDGTTYDTLGTAIRSQVSELKGDLVNATGIYYIDKSELNISGYLRNDGTVVPLSDTNTWVSSDYIEVSDLSKIYYKLHGLNTSSGIKVANVVFCDVNKTGVGSFNIRETTSNNGEDYIRVIDVPPYCKYIRICSYSGKDYEFMCIKNNELMPNIYDATNYFTTQNGFIDSNGVFKEVINVGWYATDYINVSEFNRIDYNLKGSNAVSIVCVYDSSYNLINKVVPTSSSDKVINGTLDITNGKYIRLCSFGYVGKNLLYSVANKEKQQWENTVNKPYLFNGKNALFFGDSITKGYINGNEITENNYPKLFSDSVGMSFINYGVGGATLSRVDGYSCIYDQIVNATFSNVDFVFVAGGVNDWQLGVSLSDFRTSVTNICNYLKSNFNGEVIFITPIENAGWTPLTTPIADIDEYRNVISEVVLTNGYSLINGKSLNFPNKDSNTLLISTLFGDKLHPTEKGYIQYSKGLRTILC